MHLSKMKSAQLARSALQTFAFVLGLTLLFALVGCGGDVKKTASKKPDTASIAPSSTLTSNTGSIWSEVTLVDGQIYFGFIDKVEGSDYYAIWNAYYPNAKDEVTGDATGISRVGTELHAPESYIIINKESIRTHQQLKSNSPLVKAIKESDGYTSGVMPTIKDWANLSPIAVFLKDGSMIFGSLVNGADGEVGIKNAYYLAKASDLVTNDDSSASQQDTEITSFEDLKLVPQANSDLGRSDTIWITKEAFLAFEHLSAKSEVKRAMQAATEQ